MYVALVYSVFYHIYGISAKYCPIMGSSFEKLDHLAWKSTYILYQYYPINVENFRSPFYITKQRSCMIFSDSKLQSYCNQKINADATSKHWFIKVNLDKTENFTPYFNLEYLIKK